MNQAPPNHLVKAILTTIFCCLPLGVVAIVFAAQVNSAAQTGQMELAQENARKANQFANYALIAGIVGSVLYILFVVVLGFGAAAAAG